jgi:hypothetical protein
MSNCRTTSAAAAVYVMLPVLMNPLTFVVQPELLLLLLQQGIL